MAAIRLGLILELQHSKAYKMMHTQLRYMSCDMTKPTKWVCAQRRFKSAWASTQSDQSSLSAWRNLGSLATHWAHSEDSDQTGRMPRLIWVFTECIHVLTLLVLSCSGSYHPTHLQSDQMQSLISLHCPHEEALHPWLPIEHQAKNLIRLNGCGWLIGVFACHTWFCRFNCGWGSYFLLWCRWNSILCRDMSRSRDVSIPRYPN